MRSLRDGHRRFGTMMMRMVVGVVEVVDVVVEGRGMVAVDIGNGDDGKWLSLDLLIFRLFAGYKHSAGVSAFVSTIFQYIMDDLENLSTN